MAAGRAWLDVYPGDAAAFAASIPDSKHAGNRSPASAIKSHAPIHDGAMIREADDDAKAR